MAKVFSSIALHADDLPTTTMDLGDKGGAARLQLPANVDAGAEQDAGAVAY